MIYVVDRFKYWEHSGHIADYASEML